MRRSTWPLLTIIGLVTHACTMALTGCASARQPDFNSCRTKAGPECRQVVAVLSDRRELLVCDSDDLDEQVQRFNATMGELGGPTIVEVRR